MALETASYIAGLVVTNPDGADQRSTTDDHLRLIKAVLKRTLPLADGAISLSHTQFMFLGDLSASVQIQFNQLRDGSATANNAVNSRFANSASLALFANSASFASIANTANSSSYAVLAGHAASSSFAVLAQTANSASFAVRASHAASASFATTAATATTATTAATATTATTAATATSAASATNADMVDGYHASEAATGSTVAARNSAGDVFVRYLNQSSAAEAAAVDGIWTTQGDGYHRKATPAHAGQYISAQNISGRTGTTKTLSTSAPSGGSNGDIHYRY